MASNSKIISLEEEDEYINLLVYGKSGVGKTVFGGSANNVLFIAPEDDGTISAKRMGSKAKKWSVKEWDDINEAYIWLEENPGHGFEWVVIDSITYMQQLLLRAILDDVVAENPTRDLDIPAIQDHQKWQNMFKRFVTRFNALPVNILWTGLVRVEKDEDGEEFLVPDVAGKGYQMAQTICSYMTSFGYLQVKRVKVKPKEEGGEVTYKMVRTITWEDTGVIQGKDRTGVLAPKTTNKTLQQVHDLIFGEEVPAITAKSAADAKAKRLAAKKAVQKPVDITPNGEEA